MSTSQTVTPTVGGHLRQAGDLAYAQAKTHWNSANKAIIEQGGFWKATSNGLKGAWSKNPLGVIAVGAGATIVAGHVACAAYKGHHARKEESRRDSQISQGQER